MTSRIWRFATNVGEPEDEENHGSQDGFWKIE